MDGAGAFAPRRLITCVLEQREGERERGREGERERGREGQRQRMGEGERERERERERDRHPDRDRDRDRGTEGLRKNEFVAWNFLWL